jgi:hypothetical protein
MNILRIFRRLWLVILLIFKTIVSDCQEIFSKQDAVDDLNYYYDQIKKVHVNFTYKLSESVLEKKIDSLIVTLPDSLSTKSFWYKTSPFFNENFDAHTGLDYYIDETFVNSDKLLPFNISSENNSYFINNCIDNSLNSIQILKINTLKIEDIIDTLIVFAKGDRYEARKAVVMNNLPYFYSLLFSPTSAYSIELQSDYRTEQLIIKSTEFSNLKFFKKTPSINLINEVTYKITIPSFDYNINFKDFFIYSFDSISKTNCRNIVIDLRNNLGGVSSNADLLMSYLCNKKIQTEITIMRNSKLTRDYYKSILVGVSYFYYLKKILFEKTYRQLFLYHKDNITIKSTTDFQYSNNYKKYNFLIITNNSTLSTAAYFSAVAKFNNIAYVIGDYSGEFSNSYTNSIPLKLPKSGLDATISNEYIELPPYFRTKLNIEPSLFIKDKDIESYIRNLK